MKCTYLSLAYAILLISFVFSQFEFKHSIFSALLLLISLLLFVIHFIKIYSKKNKNDNEDSDYHLYV